MQLSSEQKIEFIKDAWNIFVSHSPKEISEVFSENAEWLTPSTNATALALDCSSHLIGKHRIAEFLYKKFHSLFCEDISVRFISLYCDNQTVIAEIHLHSTLTNGRRYDNVHCFFFELRDGRVATVREYMDTLKESDCILG